VAFDGDSSNSFGNPRDVGWDMLLTHLTTGQYLHPHLSTLDVLDQTTERFGCCPQAIRRALVWLHADGEKAIGRLRRSELVQLARAVHRFWLQGAGTAVPAAQA
jgi:hypothetical protein